MPPLQPIPPQTRRDRDADWFANAAEVLDAAPSWPAAAAQLGLSPEACRAMANRLRGHGYAIRAKGRGGRPSLASMRTAPSLGPSEGAAVGGPNFVAICR